MSWYLVKIIYQIICGNGDHTPQFDEQLKLVAAASSDELLHKAASAGYAGEDTFHNHQQQLVRWRFVGVSEVYPFHALTDGMELYSTIHERDDAEAYIRLVNEKSAGLRAQITSRSYITLS